MSAYQFRLTQDIRMISWKINEDGSLDDEPRNRDFGPGTVISNLKVLESNPDIYEGTAERIIGMDKVKFKVHITDADLNGVRRKVKLIGGSRRRKSSTTKKNRHRRSAKKTERKRRRQ